MCASNGIPDVPRDVGLNRPALNRYAGWWAVLAVVFLVGLPNLSAAAFSNFLQETNPPVIVSEKEATVFFLKTFGSSLDLPGGLLRQRQTSPLLPNGLRQHLSPFVANIATWHLTRDLMIALDQGKRSQIQSILDKRQQQSEWLGQSQPKLPALLAMVETMAQLQPTESSAQPLSPYEALFTQFLHEQYPDWTGTPDSWLTLAQTEGAEGVRKRLRDSWDSRHEEPDPTPSINRFLRQSFLPIATAHVKADLLRLQVRNEQQAWTTWQAIQEWSSNRKNEQGLRRLCGTWQWLIHNHQDHGDHKTIMIYPPPSQYHRMDPQPATIRVQGDTVYIRWEFPRGIIQEESLLFGEKDQLLSGTFVNNLGPNGNITGRRVKPCQEQ